MCHHHQSRPCAGSSRAAGLALPAAALGRLLAALRPGDSLSDVGNIGRHPGPLVAANGGPAAHPRPRRPGTPSPTPPTGPPTAAGIDVFRRRLRFHLGRLPLRRHQLRLWRRPHRQPALQPAVSPSSRACSSSATPCSPPARPSTPMPSTWCGAAPTTCRTSSPAAPRRRHAAERAGQTVADLADIIDSLAAAGATTSWCPTPPTSAWCRAC